MEQCSYMWTGVLSRLNRIRNCLRGLLAEGLLPRLCRKKVASLLLPDCYFHGKYSNEFHLCSSTSSDLHSYCLPNQVHWIDSSPLARRKFHWDSFFPKNSLSWEDASPITTMLISLSRVSILHILMLPSYVLTTTSFSEPPPWMALGSFIWRIIVKKH